MSELAFDDSGFPVLLDVEVPTRSGNPTHSVGGRFGNRDDKEGEKKQTVPSQGAVSEEEAGRRQDAIRDAAREFEVFKDQDIKEWLKGRINQKPGGFTQIDVDAFLRDVRAQQLSDLIDVLDQNERGVMRGRRFVRVQAPRGYTRKLLGALTDIEIKMLGNRLKARGWSDKQLKGLATRFPEEKQTIFDALDDFSQEPVYFESDDSSSKSEVHVQVAAPKVEVKIPEPAAPRKKIIHRDSKGLIESIEEV